jgi:hypothetical protein
MQVQLNTDNHIQGDDKLAAWVEGEISTKLDRFGDHITRVEVHLSDSNAGRGGDADKRCTLEARPAGRPPVAVTHDAGTVADALGGAVGKMVRALDTAQGRARDAHGRESIRGEAQD